MARKNNNTKNITLSIADCKSFPNTFRRNFTGKTIGCWTVLGYLRSYAYKSGAIMHVWLCQCACKTIETLTSSALYVCATQNRKCPHQPIYFVHGLYNHSAYKIYHAMMSRCYKPSDIGYHRYGGRGITVCNRWRLGENGKLGIECFIEDMGNRPSKQHSIDRINNSKGYSPNNCRWATFKEQNQNRTSLIRLEYNGKSVTILELSEQVHLPPNVIYQRHKSGWDIHRIVNTPHRQRAKRKSP